MKEPTPEPAAKEIDAKAEGLIREFVEHVRAFQAQNPGDHGGCWLAAPKPLTFVLSRRWKTLTGSPRKIFEGWTIQKIAALQYTVLQLTDELVKIWEQIRKR